MKFIDDLLFLAMDVVEGNVNTLILERQENFSRIVFNIFQQSKGYSGPISITNGMDKFVNLEKDILLFFNPFEINLNDRRFINSLYSQIVSQISDYVDLKNQIVTDGYHLLEKIEEEFDCINLKFSFEPDMREYLKSWKVEFDDDTSNLFERVISLLKICTYVNKYSLLIFVGFKQYFTFEEFSEFVKMVRYFGVTILLIEPQEINIAAGENVCIVDRDSCIIPYVK